MKFRDPSMPIIFSRYKKSVMDGWMDGQEDRWKDKLNAMI